jgi:flagellar assembly protein FliH
MSSSKVFKKDAQFTPIPLVQRTLAGPVKTAPSGHGQSPVPVASAEASPAVNKNEPPPQPTPTPEPAIDLEAVRQEAYNRGAADQSARFQADLEAAVSAFAEACRLLDNQRRKMLDHSRGDMITLIIALTEKIVRQELATPRNVVAAALQAALEQAIDSEEHYVTLHPDDLAAAEAKTPELIAAVRGLERIVFKTDPGMTRGGCLLESAACTVDASIEGQLTGVRDFLEEQPDLLAGNDAQSAPIDPTDDDVAPAV